MGRAKAGHANYYRFIWYPYWYTVQFVQTQITKLFGGGGGGGGGGGDVPCEFVVRTTIILCYKSIISRILIGNKIIDHSDVASSVGAAIATSSFST